MKLFFTLLFISLLLTGCATTPVTNSWRPWTIVRQPRGVVLDSIISLEVSGVSGPLLGDNYLLNQSIYNTTQFLLSRKGYNVVDSIRDSHMTISYKTKEVVLNNLSLYNTSIYRSYKYLGSQTGGYGVAVINRILDMSYNLNAQTLDISTKIYYEHSLSIKIAYNDNMVLKGESLWISNRVNIDNDIITPLQMILSNISVRNDIVPVVNKVIKHKARNYYYINCFNRVFSCPALPYNIRFNSYQDYNLLADYSLPSTIKNPEALDAIVDLIRTSEYALPKGLKDYSNPLKKNLWRKAQLGGTYKLGISGDTVNILVDLVGDVNGYRITKARIASNDEYNEYRQNMKLWKTALKDYFTVFK